MRSRIISSATPLFKAAQWLELTVACQRLSWPAADSMSSNTRIVSPNAQFSSPSRPRTSMAKSTGWSRSQSPPVKAKLLSSKGGVGSRGFAPSRDGAGLRSVHVIDHRLVQPEGRNRTRHVAAAAFPKLAAVGVGAAGDAGVHVATARGVSTQTAAGVDVPEAGTAAEQLVVHDIVHVVPVDGAERGLRAHAAPDGAERPRPGQVLVRPDDDAGDAPGEIRYPGRFRRGAGELAPGALEARLPAHHDGAECLH